MRPGIALVPVALLAVLPARAQEAPSTDAGTLDAVVVRGERDYRDTASGTAAKLDVPLRDIP